MRTIILMLFAAMWLQACETPTEPDVTQMPQGDFLEEMGLKPDQPDQVIANFVDKMAIKTTRNPFVNEGETANCAEAGDLPA